MHIHILGICGTFMGSLAILAKQLGHKVTGSDSHVYPPMSTQLEEAGIALYEGYEPDHLRITPDLVVIGNALARGNPAVEHVLNHSIPYTSGPAWLAQEVLQKRQVLAVAGTHGKTTTTSMLSWILQEAGYEPGFLIGGVPVNFGVSARVGASDWFVIEADEYDTAFFDKRSKFVHYRPQTLILNNLEYDHADIFPDLAAIQTQFHHLVRTIPGQGAIIWPKTETAIAEVIAKGCWTPQHYLHDPQGWQARLLSADGRQFEVLHQGKMLGQVTWQLLGDHNVSNALAAIAAAYQVGVLPEYAFEALARFQSVKRRLELKGEVAGIRIFDDFAHHPTAIATTLAGLRASVGDARILAVLDLRSNTMRMGVHQQALRSALAVADRLYLHQPEEIRWDVASILATRPQDGYVCAHVEQLLDKLVAEASAGDHILIMSNGGFGQIFDKLLTRLQHARTLSA